MDAKPFPRNVESVEQRRQCRTEELVTQEIGGQVHQYSCVRIQIPDFEEKVHGVVHREQQQGYPHNTS